jgi:predicted PurR-regulated permease PerM
VIFLTPLTFFGYRVFLEAAGVYARLASGGGPLVDGVMEFLGAQFPAINVEELSGGLNAYIRDAVNWLFQNLGPVFSGLTNILTQLLISLIALYYFLKDGARIRAALLDRAPIADERYAKEIFSRIEMTVNSVVRGSLLVAVVQGILTGIGFFLFGIPSPAFLGSFAVVTALIPIVGTAVVVLPAVAYLAVSSTVGAAAGLFVWGVVIVGLADNFLRPQLMKRDVDIHPFLILLSVVGGIKFFGPIGFLLGPIVMSLLFALLDIYSHLATGRTLHAP